MNYARCSMVLLGCALVVGPALAKDDWPFATGVKGKVYYKRNPAEAWRPVKPYSAFFPGARIKTLGKSWVHMVDFHGKRRCLDANSELVFREGKGEGTWRGVSLLRGHLTTPDKPWGELAMAGEAHHYSLCVLKATGHAQYEESYGWLRVRPHFDGYTGHRIKTADNSTLVARVWDGSIVRLEPNTLVKLHKSFTHLSNLEVQRGKVTILQPPTRD
jgi:hypothetical protein